MKIQNINKCYGEKTVLSDFSADMGENALYLLTGESGAGKTTLIRVIAGLEKADGGQITGAGKISLLFQEDRLFSHLTARENILAVCGDGDRADKLLGAMFLSEAADKKPAELSGGMSRRVAIARTLSYDADTYIFDEPLKGLDPSLKSVVARLIIRETEGKRVIIVTHETEDFSFCPSKRINIEKI